jgi:SAM-dependent methyltransferase
MKIALEKIRKFYKSSLGEYVLSCLKPYISSFLPLSLRHKSILGIGFAENFIDTSLSQKNILIHCFPNFFYNGLGGCETAENNVFFHEHALPFLNQSVDYAILIHSCEFFSNSDCFFEELWRILSPEALTLIIVPNRQGVWSWFDSTPFGYGHPYTMSQLKDFLAQKGFLIYDENSALFYPPLHLKKGTSFFKYLENFGRRYLKKIAGVNIVYAQKKAPVFLLEPVLDDQISKVKQRQH